MLAARYLVSGQERWGVVESDALLETDGPPFDGGRPTGAVRDLREVSLLPPCRPSKILAVGLNYRDHAEELGHPIPREPVLFMKPPSSLLAPGGEIVLPAASVRVDYEAELALVVRDRCRGLSAGEASAHILGYCCANDVTARDLQERDGQWTRAKGYDTFCPLGPWLAVGIDPGGLRISLRLNGEVRQDSSTSAMLFSPAELLSFISGIMTLEAGDVILTGTPPGVGALASGDEVEVDIEGIGTLRNRVASD